MIASGTLIARGRDRAVQVVVEPYLRLDARDAERSCGDLRRGYIRYLGDHWDLTLSSERAFPGEASRSGLAFPLHESAATFERRRGKDADDAAPRYSNRFGGFDLGLYAFYAADALPRF